MLIYEESLHDEIMLLHHFSENVCQKRGFYEVHKKSSFNILNNTHT